MFLLFTGTVLVGVVLGSYLPYVPLSILLLLILAAILVTVSERHGRLTAREGAVLYGGLLLGVVLWVVSTWNGAGSSLTDFDGQGPVAVEGTVIEPPVHAPNRMVLVLSVVQVGEGSGPRAVTGRLRLTWREPDRTFAPGDQVAFTARIHPPSGTRNPGGFDYGAYLLQQGVDAVASVAGPGRVTVRASPPAISRWEAWRMIEEWRGRIRRAALATLRDPASGIYAGMIIGEQGYLAQEIRDVFMATGTVHILSISGSHLGLVALLSFALVKGLCRALPASWLLALSRRVTPTRLAASATVLLVTFYTLLAGAGVATVRSWVMIAVFLLAVWLGRTHDLLRAVACAALLLVVHNPRALFDISFQLSYVAVLAIALVVGRRDGSEPGDVPPPSMTIWETAGKWLREYLWLTGSVTLATVPLVAYYFKQIAWLGLIANVVVVPLAGFVLVPLGLGSAVWLLVTGQESLPAASLNQALLGLMSDTVSLLARVPGAEWHVASPAAATVAVFYLLLFAASRPITDQRDRWRRWGCILVAAAVLSWWGWSPRSWPDGETLRVTFLDVGQGDACVLELPDGQAVLIDGGSRYDTLDMGRAVVGPYLWERGITRLDHVLATHPQLDHVGGLAWVLRSFEIGRYWSNGMTRDEPFYRHLQDAVRARGIVEERAEEGRPIVESGPCRLDVVNPPAGGGQPHGGNPAGMSSGSLLNNLSIVTRLECGTHAFLFTADVEHEALSRLYERGTGAAIEVLKVPHHGAASSLHEPWIRHIRGRTAVVSVGRHNAYGHPDPRVMAAYARAGVHVLRTDSDGAVWMTARLSRPEVRIQTARDAMLRPVSISPMVLTTEFFNLRRIGQRWTGWFE